MPSDPQSPLPLVADLDGTIVRTDTLYETVAHHIFHRPLLTILAILALFRGGKSKMKARLSDLGVPDPDTLPYNDEFVTYLREEKANGRALHLATAADQRIANRIAAHMGLFDSAQGTHGEVNLKGGNKGQALETAFPDGFTYAGDHAADLDVWKKAKSAVLVGVSDETRRSVISCGIEVEKDFPGGKDSSLKLWGKQLRLHQWTKNILIFVPLFLAHAYTEIASIMAAIAAFFIMGIVASGTYILNDLADLASDRAHRTKRLRPFASGALKVRDGLIAGPGLIGIGLLLALLLSTPFAGFLLVYLLTTMGYSFGLKRLPIIDVFILGFLYTLRLLMGVAVIGVVLSPWLIAFAFCFFLSMSIAKRHVELVSAKDLNPDEVIKGRGYRPADWPLTLSAGQASTFASVLVIALYLTEEAFNQDHYRTPEFLWAAPALILLWTQRIWLLAHRGELHDDPVSFAVKDRHSIILGGILGVFFLLAVGL